jgi:hypothetical protein
MNVCTSGWLTVNDSEDDTTDRVNTRQIAAHGGARPKTGENPTQNSFFQRTSITSALRTPVFAARNRQIVKNRPWAEEIGLSFFCSRIQVNINIERIY